MTTTMKHRQDTAWFADEATRRAYEWFVTKGDRQEIARRLVPLADLPFTVVDPCLRMKQASDRLLTHPGFQPLRALLREQGLWEQVVFADLWDALSVILCRMQWQVLEGLQLSSWQRELLRFLFDDPNALLSFYFYKEELALERFPKPLLSLYAREVLSPQQAQTFRQAPLMQQALLVQREGYYTLSQLTSKLVGIAPLERIERRFPLALVRYLPFPQCDALAKAHAFAVRPNAYDLVFRDEDYQRGWKLLEQRRLTLPGDPCQQLAWPLLGGMIGLGARITRALPHTCWGAFLAVGWVPGWLHEREALSLAWHAPFPPPAQADQYATQPLRESAEGTTVLLHSSSLGK